jgi:hypothetical protein
MHSIECIEALGEPAVDWSEKIAGLIPLTLIAPEPRHAHCCAEFPGLCLLLTGNNECAVEIRFCFFWIWRERLECDFAGDAIGSASNTELLWNNANQ